MTYATDLGYKVGDKFYMLVDGVDVFKAGDEIILCCDDESACPMFVKASKYVEGVFHYGYNDYEYVELENVQLLVEETPFKVGDKVKVVRKVDGYDPNGMGKGKTWKNSWQTNMQEVIGREFVVEDIRESGVYFVGYSFGFPITALEKVVEEKSQVAPATKIELEVDIKNLQEMKKLLLEIEEIYNRIFKRGE